MAYKVNADSAVPDYLQEELPFNNLFLYPSDGQYSIPAKELDLEKIRRLKLKHAYSKTAHAKENFNTSKMPKKNRSPFLRRTRPRVVRKVDNIDEKINQLVKNVAIREEFEPRLYGNHSADARRLLELSKSPRLNAYSSRNNDPDNSEASSVVSSSSNAGRAAHIKHYTKVASSRPSAPTVPKPSNISSRINRKSESISHDGEVSNAQKRRAMKNIYVLAVALSVMKYLMYLYKVCGYWAQKVPLAALVMLQRRVRIFVMSKVNRREYAKSLVISNFMKRVKWRRKVLLKNAASTLIRSFLVDYTWDKVKLSVYLRRYLLKVQCCKRAFLAFLHCTNARVNLLMQIGVIIGLEKQYVDPNFRVNWRKVLFQYLKTQRLDYLFRLKEWKRQSSKKEFIFRRMDVNDARIFLLTDYGEKPFCLPQIMNVVYNDKEHTDGRTNDGNDIVSDDIINCHTINNDPTLRASSIIDVKIPARPIIRLYSDPAIKHVLSELFLSVPKFTRTVAVTRVAAVPLSKKAVRMHRDSETSSRQNGEAGDSLASESRVSVSTLV